MLPSYASAVVICLVALALGRGVLVLSGFDRWTWLAAPVGYALLLFVSEVAVRLPGRSTTAFVLVLLLTGAALAVGRRRRFGWPPLEALAVAAVVLVALAVPFVANWRSGTLGISFLNDTHWHLMWAEYWRHPTLAHWLPPAPGYPQGPHATAAVFAQLLGTSVTSSLNGVLMATPVLTALAALEFVRDVGPLRRWLVAVFAALTYLGVSWYAQSAFKEPMLSLFVLGSALLLEDAIRTRLRQPLRAAIPAAVLVAGILYTYGHLGLVWPGLTLGVWAVLALTLGGGWRKLPSLRPLARPAGIAAAVGGGLIVLAVLADVNRIFDFVNQVQISPAGTPGGIQRNDLANLAGPLHPLIAFGVWLREDFRFLPPDSYAAGAWSALAVIVCLFGVVWALERRELVRPAVLIACAGVYLVTRHTQSPYVAAKALVVPGPLIAIVGGRALMRWLQDAPWARIATWVVAAAGILFLFLAFKSSYLALRGAQVGPSAHQHELRSLRPALSGGPTLDLVYDDYFQWNLLGIEVSDPVVASPIPAPFSPQKPWSYGQAIDFDSMDAATLDRFLFVITARTTDQSEAPANFRVVARSPSYEVWKRSGPTPARRVLPESGAPGAVLDCATAAGRRIAASAGTARVRVAPISTNVPSLQPGGTTTVTLKVPAGDWDLSLPYVSQQDVTVRGGGLAVRLPATLDRPGAPWPVGRLRSTGAPIALTLHMDDPSPIYSGTQFFTPLPLVAVSTRPAETVPLRRACGRYVDWYTTG